MTRKPITFFLDPRLIRWLYNAAAWHWPERSRNDLVEEALTRWLHQAEEERGGAYPVHTGPLPMGRPPDRRNWPTREVSHD